MAKDDAARYDRLIAEIFRRHYKKGVTRFEFDREEIELLSWHALSPDLNPVENLWSIITQRVYASEAPHENEDALWEAISWETWSIEKSLSGALWTGFLRACAS